MKIAIIPARGGSKRIPRKNIREFCGQPIMAYSIQAALKSGLFDTVMVSTDDAEIAEIAQEFGAQVPFKRSAKNSGDLASTAEVLAEVLEQYSLRGQEFEQVCCIYPAAPFVTAEKLTKGMSLLAEQANYVLPVVQYSYNPLRAVVIRDNYIHMQYPQFLGARSQDLEPIYHDCGQFYCAKTAAFLRDKTLIGEKTVPLIMPESEVQDIDTPEDWKAAESKFQRMSSQDG
ncbi:MAG: pseudaminic acid cytidylyltransferase [Peptococcaceae bacterium]|nr:pseudaminic acid cytidylyltransferase [Peptococcaceae bacterium]